MQLLQIIKAGRRQLRLHRRAKLQPRGGRLPLLQLCVPRACVRGAAVLVAQLAGLIVLAWFQGRRHVRQAGRQLLGCVLDAT